MFTIGGIFGAALLGNIASAVLYGVTIVQAYNYFNSCCGDSRVMKLLVAFLLVLDTAHLGLITCGVYEYLITHFGNLIFKPAPTLIIQILITAINNAIIRGLFALRVWRLSGKNTPLLVGIAIPILFTLAGATVFVRKGLEIDSFLHIHQFNWILYMSLSTGVFVDIGTCLSLCIVLYRSQAGWPRTDSFISTFSLFTIDTGLLVALCSILTLIALATLPDTMIYMAIYFCMDSIFFNALLATLNARANLRERFGLPTMQPSTLSQNVRRRSVMSGIVVKVERLISSQNTLENSPTSPEIKKMSPIYRASTLMGKRKSIELPIQSVPVFVNATKHTHLRRSDGRPATASTV